MKQEPIKGETYKIKRKRGLWVGSGEPIKGETRASGRNETLEEPIKGETRAQGLKETSG